MNEMVIAARQRFEEHTTAQMSLSYRIGDRDWNLVEGSAQFRFGDQDLPTHAFAPDVDDVTFQWCQPFVSWTFSWKELAAQELKERIFYWVSRHPGSDAEHVSDQFGIGPVEADEILEELLNEGLLDFQE